MAPGGREPGASLPRQARLRRVEDRRSPGRPRPPSAQMFVFSSSAEAKLALQRSGKCSPVRGGVGSAARGARRSVFRRAPSLLLHADGECRGLPRSAPRSRRKVCQRSRGGVRGGTGDSPARAASRSPCPFWSASPGGRGDCRPSLTSTVRRSLSRKFDRNGVARPVARDDLPQPFRIGDVHPVGLDDQVAPESSSSPARTTIRPLATRLRLRRCRGRRSRRADRSLRIVEDACDPLVDRPCDDTEERVIDVAALGGLGDDVTDGVDRYRKPDAGVPRDCAPHWRSPS